MTIREAEIIENAKKPFEFNAEEGDDIVIVSDTGMDPVVWSVLNKAARSLGHDPTVVVMSQAEYSHAEPPKPVIEAMMGGGLVLMATSKGLGHSEAGSEVIGAGKKVILMSEVVPETLSSGAAGADYDKIKHIGDRVKEKWDAGSTVEITSAAGTNLNADITSQEASVHAGRCDEGNDQMDAKDGSPVRICAFPDGESPITPVFGSTNGTLVWDTTMHEIGPIAEPIRAEVEDGFVTEITGGREAGQLTDFLESFDDENVYNIAEISVNTNPSAEITGRLREDKKAAGYLHVAVGSGGDVEAPVHLDGVIGGATLKIDDEVIVDDGEIVVE